MKKQIIFSLAAFTAAGMMTSCGKYSAQTATLNDQNDSINYALGYANGDGIKNYYMNNVDDQDAAIKAFIDALDKAYNSDAEPDEMYQLGLQLGTTLARQKAEGLMGNEDLKFDYDLAMQGMKQGIEGAADSTAWTPAEAQQYIQETMMQLQAEKAAKQAAEQAAKDAAEAAQKPAVEEDTVAVEE